MGIFSLQEWKSLWNLNKPPKGHPSLRRNNHMYSSSARLNYSSGDATPRRRYDVVRYDSQPDEPYDLDQLDSCATRQPNPSRVQGRRGQSLPRNLRHASKDYLDQQQQQHSPTAEQYVDKGQGFQDESGGLPRQARTSRQMHQANGMVEQPRLNDGPQGTSTPLAEIGGNSSPRTWAEASTTATGKPTHVTGKSSIANNNNNQPVDADAAHYATVQKGNLASWNKQRLEQPGLAQSSWYKSRSQRELLNSSGDEVSEVDNARIVNNSRVDSRPLAKDRLSSWDRTKFGHHQPANGKSTEVPPISRYDSPAKQSHFDVHSRSSSGGTNVNVDEDKGVGGGRDGQQLLSGGVSKFNEARRKFQELAEASQNRRNDRSGPPGTLQGQQSAATGSPINETLRERFRSQPDVNSGRAKVQELYKSAAVLPMADNGTVSSSTTNRAVDNEIHYDCPRAEPMEDNPSVGPADAAVAAAASYSPSGRSGVGVDIQKRESLYKRANSSGLPDSGRPLMQSFHARPARIISVSSRTTTSKQQQEQLLHHEHYYHNHREQVSTITTGSNLALLGINDHQPDELANSGKPLRNDDARTGEGKENSRRPDDNATIATSTPRTFTRKPVRPLTRSREDLLARQERDEATEWQQEDVILRRMDNTNFGFTIIGGRGDEVRPGDSRVYIANIAPQGIAARDGRLRVCDTVVAVNGTDYTNISAESAGKVLLASGNTLYLRVRRFIGKVHIVQIELRTNGKKLGFAVTGGVGNEVRPGDTAIYVKKVFPGGVADQHGGIEVCDQLQRVNSTPLVDVTHQFAVECLRNGGDPISLVVAKTARINPLLFANQRL